jgi:hypothetical protein
MLKVDALANLELPTRWSTSFLGASSFRGMIGGRYGGTTDVWGHYLDPSGATLVRLVGRSEIRREGRDPVGSQRFTA